MKNLLKNPHLLFNIDVVGAKTGKVLTKSEKTINYIVNLLPVLVLYSIGLFVFVLIISLILNFGDIVSEFIFNHPLVAIFCVVFYLYQIIKRK